MSKEVRYILVDTMTTSDGKPLTKMELKMFQEVIAVYKIPKHLTQVEVVIQSLEEAHLGLVFKGLDSKSRMQYFYGKTYVKNRKENRIETVLLMHKVWPKLAKLVQTLLTKDYNTKEYNIGLLLYICCRTFIRIGCEKFFHANGTTGLVTMLTTSVSVVKDILYLDFVAKDKVHQRFSLAIPDNISTTIAKKISEGNKFLFTYNNGYNRLKEMDVLDILEPLGITPKNIRTYGANCLFIVNALQSQEKNCRKLISAAISKTAATIGHTKGICKSAYIASQVIECVATLCKEKDDKGVRLLDAYLIPKRVVCAATDNPLTIYRTYIDKILKEAI